MVRPLLWRKKMKESSRRNWPLNNGLLSGEVVGKPRGDRWPEQATERGSRGWRVDKKRRQPFWVWRLFTLSLTRDGYFRTVFRFSSDQTPRKHYGYKGKPGWHRCCLASQQNRSTTFRLSKNIVLMKLTSSLLWLVLAFMSAAVIHASVEEVQPYAIPGRYIVVLKQGHRPAEVLSRHGVKA